MSPQTPLVSIGVPVYNGENYLETALIRLLQQDFENFELIISDNASTDRTEEICKAFVQRDPRVRYFRNPVNVGLAANHNRTIQEARGKYFKWAAHDDDFPREMLTGFVRALEESSPSASMVYSICEYVNENGTVTAIDSDHISSNDPWPHIRFANVLKHVHMYNSFYGLIRMDALRKTRLLGLYPMSDHVLLGELAMLGTILEIPEHLLRIRRHSGRTFTANKSRAALRDLFTPGKGHRFSILGLRSHMHFEIIRSAVLIPPRLTDKMLCLGVALGVPQWKWITAYAGIQKRNLRRLFRSAEFSAADIRQLPSLVEKLKHPAPNASISRYLASQLSLPTRYLLSKYSGGVDLPLQNALVKDLNRLIGGPLVYEPDRFENVVLSQDLQNRLNRNPSGKSVPRVNRLLLEEAYPSELSKQWRFRFVQPMRIIVRGEA